MDDAKIFMQRNAYKRSHDKNSGIEVAISGKRKLLPSSSLSTIVNDAEQYEKERYACRNLRLTVQVEPVCTNVLSNCVSEIVKDEGSESVICLNFGQSPGHAPGSINRLYPRQKQSSLFYGDDAAHNCVMDTQLSNRYCGYSYHCGKDIFNNHLLRSKTFKTVNCYGSGGVKNPENFNTIRDWMRDGDGSYISGYYDTRTEKNRTPNVQEHLYQYGEVLSYEDAVKEKQIEENGWIGFRNVPKMPSYSGIEQNDADLFVSLPINNKEACSFVDLCPERELFDFKPRYNSFKNRTEQNWNYCITYPSSATTEGIDFIAGNNGLCAAYYDEMSKADNGQRQTVIYSVSMHGLQIGDKVNLYAGSGSGIDDQELVATNVSVTDVIDDYIFCVYSDNQISHMWADIKYEMTTGDTFTAQGVTYTINKGNMTVTGGHGPFNIINYRVNLDHTKKLLTYKRVVNGREDEYYVRIFSRLPNFRFADSAITELNADEAAIEFRDRKYEFESHPSRMGFAKTIYSDGIGEIVFTDDIQFGNLHDHRGRPLTELYLTIVKNNRGYENWYGKNVAGCTHNIRANDIEYSHVFGKVTCGFKQSLESTDVPFDYKSADRITNEDDRNPRSSGLYMWNTSDGEINYRDTDEGIFYNHPDYNDRDEVNFYSVNHYYGDLASYNEETALETVIQPTMFRFNTAQRELNSAAKFNAFTYFNRFYVDELITDDYDTNSFNCEKIEGSTRCCVHNEGYYYQSHYKIPIRTYSSELTVKYPKIFPVRFIEQSDNGYTVTTIQDNYMEVGDVLYFYDRENDEDYKAHVTEIDGTRVFTCTLDGGVTPNNSITPTGFRVLRPEATWPSYATMIHDGSCRFIWREILENGQDDSVEEYPFTNNALYANLMVRLYLRRQDPYGYNDLYEADDLDGNVWERVIKEDAMNVEDIEC